jgi:hypothetical protein
VLTGRNIRRDESKEMNQPEFRSMPDEGVDDDAKAR